MKRPHKNLVFSMFFLVFKLGDGTGQTVTDGQTDVRTDERTSKTRSAAY